MTRQMRRAQQRQQAKAKVINATPLALGMLTVFDPTLWRPQPEPVQSIATDCNRAAAEPAAGADAGAGVVTETKRCDRCRNTKPLEAFSKRGGRLAFGSPDGHRSTCKACVKPRITARGIPKPPKIQGTTKPGNRPRALASSTLILTPEFIRQAHQKACKDWKAAEILRGVAGVEIDTPRQIERQYTPTGWPVDPFARSAQKIRIERFLKSRQTTDSVHVMTMA